MKKIRVKNKFLRRLLGEEKGLVMFEYILLGLLIGTACIAGAWMISRAIKGGFTTMAKGATTASQAEIQAAAQSARDTQQADQETSDKHHESVTGD